MNGMKRTWKMMKKGDNRIKLSENRDLIVVLGPIGSGKSTLTSLLTSNKNKMTAVAISAGVFVIKDNNNKIGSRSLNSMPYTSLPEMISDETTRAVFYDTPGFIDSWNSSIVITSAYFMKKVLNHAKKIKLVFAIDHKTVHPTSSKDHFLKFLKHANAIIPNVDKFQDSICMIFTKVQNIYGRKNDVLTLVDDDTTIRAVAKDLKTYLASNEKEMNQNMIRLVKIILTKQDEKYSRIALFRIPENEGPLSDIKMMQETKEIINRMIHRDLKYTSSNGDDFSFTITDQAQVHIIDMLRDTTQRVVLKLIGSMKKIKQHFENEEKQSLDIKDLQMKYVNASSQLSNIVKSEKTMDGLMEVFKKGQEVIQYWNINGLEQDSADVVRLKENLRLITVVSPKQNNLESFEAIMQPVETITHLFEGLENWFTFLLTLRSVTSGSERLSISPVIYNSLKAKIGAADRNESHMMGLDLAEFLDEISTRNRSIFGHNYIKNVTIDSVRAQQLNRILGLIAVSEPTHECYDAHKLRITGLDIKLSDALAVFGCPSKLKFMEIYAGDKLLIDADMIEVVKKLTLVIVAPVWEVLKETRIQLRGYDASPHSQPLAAVASNGIASSVENQTYGRNGKSGLPGLPGGNGGNVFGIAGVIINPEKLTIAVDGGNGGPGQCGGNGGDGAEGAKATIDLSNRGEGTLYNYLPEYAIMMKYGTPGGIGGVGGYGGAGGLGGHAGNIHIFTSKISANINTSEKNGMFGANGKQGLGGMGGLDGECCMRRISLHVGDYFRSTLKCGPDCPRPQRRRNDYVYDDYNNHLHHTGRPKFHPNWTNARSNYRNYTEGIVEQYHGLEISTTWLDSIKQKYTTGSRRTTRANLSTGFIDFVHSSLYLVDFIMRKCTKIKVQHPYKDEGNDEIFVNSTILTVRFEGLLKELHESGKISDDCKGFDPFAMIEELKILMRKNRYEEIHEMLIDRLREFGLNSEIETNTNL